MLNLLAFRKSKEDVARYHEYGQQFNKVAAPFGGEPKILGSVVKPPAQATAAGSYPDSRGRPDRTEPWWDEISIVHYPSLRQFNDMASSSAYQGINRELRLPSLRVSRRRLPPQRAPMLTLTRRRTRPSSARKRYPCSSLSLRTA
jgi:uncharacterized protein (DUF1330 family)